MRKLTTKELEEAFFYSPIKEYYDENCCSGCQKQRDDEKKTFLYLFKDENDSLSDDCIVYRCPKCVTQILELREGQPLTEKDIFYLKCMNRI